MHQNPASGRPSGIRAVETPRTVEYLGNHRCRAAAGRQAAFLTRKAARRRAPAIPFAASLLPGAATARLLRRLGVIVGAMASHIPPAPAQPSPPATAFVDVTVVPMDANRVLRGQTVVVEGDRIVTVGPNAAVTIPAGTRRIAGQGRFLMPGLGEMHGHNPPRDASPEFVEAIYFLFVANGVTTVRSMLSAAGDLALRERVRRQQAEGWDLLKVQGSIRRGPYDAMVRTAREIGIRFGGHVPADVGLVHALESRQETIDHLDGYIDYLEGNGTPVDSGRLERAVALTRAAGTAVVPTMQVWDILTGAVTRADALNRPELKYLPPAQVERWTQENEKRISREKLGREGARQLAANRRALLKALHEAGVPVLFGTDAPQQFSVPGFSVHRELKVMAEIGMSPYEILRSATRNIGEYFKDTDRFGTVAPGRRADLILLEANPLVDVAHVARRAGVMVRGRWLPEAEIQRRLEAIATRWRKS